MTWHLLTTWQPSATASRSSLEVRCGSCARTAHGARHPAPPEVVAWLAEQRACCAACGKVIVVAPGGER